MPKEIQTALMITVIIVLAVELQTIYAQTHNVEPLYIEMGVQYRIDGVWVTQFRGRVHELNETAIRVTWYRYDETEPIRNATLNNNDAEDYELSLRFTVNDMNNTDKTYGSFRVYWLQDSTIIDIDNDDGWLVIRDKNGVKRSYEDIQRTRKYEYEVGTVQ